jgi:hypothetical protein
MNVRHGLAVVLLATFLATPLLAQKKPTPNENGVPHDISQVEPAPLGGAIAVPIPPAQQRRMKKYDMPELTGARQAIGSQLIEGRLPRPLVDYIVQQSNVRQRLSIFEGGLTVIDMRGAGGIIHKKVVIPPDAAQVYLKNVKPEVIRALRLTPPRDDRQAILQVYDEAGVKTAIAFDPLSTIPKRLQDGVLPLEDLLRAMSEDRTVTSSLPGYEPKVGDELVGDDRKTWRVERIVNDGDIVVLHCTSQPTLLYVAKKDLYNYFVGSRATAAN